MSAFERSWYFLKALRGPQAHQTFVTQPKNVGDEPKVESSIPWGTIHPSIMSLLARKQKVNTDDPDWQEKVDTSIRSANPGKWNIGEAEPQTTYTLQHPLPETMRPHRDMTPMTRAIPELRPWEHGDKLSLAGQEGITQHAEPTWESLPTDLNRRLGEMPGARYT